MARKDDGKQDGLGRFAFVGPITHGEEVSDEEFEAGAWAAAEALAAALARQAQAAQEMELGAVEEVPVDQLTLEGGSQPAPPSPGMRVISGYITASFVAWRTSVQYSYARNSFNALLAEVGWHESEEGGALEELQGKARSRRKPLSAEDRVRLLELLHSARASRDRAQEAWTDAHRIAGSAPKFDYQAYMRNCEQHRIAYEAAGEVTATRRQVRRLLRHRHP